MLSGFQEMWIVKVQLGKETQQNTWGQGKVGDIDVLEWVSIRVEEMPFVAGSFCSFRTRNRLKDHFWEMFNAVLEICCHWGNISRTSLGSDGPPLKPIGMPMSIKPIKKCYMYISAAIRQCKFVFCPGPMGTRPLTHVNSFIAFSTRPHVVNQAHCSSDMLSSPAHVAVSFQFLHKEKERELRCNLRTFSLQKCSISSLPF